MPRRGPFALVGEGELEREVREDLRVMLDDKHDAGLARVDVAEIVAQRHPREFGDGASHFDAGRASADHDEGEKLPAALGRLRRLGRLEGRQDAPTNAGGVVDLLQAGRHTFPFVAAEIGVPRARRQHEIIVGDLAFLGGATFHDHSAAPVVDAGHLAQYDAHIGSPAQDSADGRGDLGR